jgi:hypothetical protein
MYFFNPIELLQLNYYEIKRLDQAVIQDALSKFRAKVAEGAAVYHDRPVTDEMLSEAERLLQNPSEVSFYYYLAKYPGLARFLAGDHLAEIEKDSLQLHAEQLEEGAAAILSPVALKLVTEAFGQNALRPLEAFTQQTEKGSKHFQQAVFAASIPLLESRKDKIATIVREIEEDLYPYEQLRGLGVLREHIPVDVLNTLPAPFEGTIHDIRKLLGSMAHQIAKSEPALALAIVRYALRIEGTETYTAKLEKAQAQLDQSSRKSQQQNAGGIASIGLIAGGIALVLLLLGGWYAWEKMNAFNDMDEQAEREGAASRLETAETEDAPSNAYLHLNWWERGYEKPGEGTVAAGEAPLDVCFPTVKTSGPNQRITIIGDPAYDALVFFFNGRDYFKQAYIPANSQYVINHALSGEKVSTLLVFGQNWDEEKTSPCGTKGYFADKIFYGGFSSYATDPPYLSLATEDIMFLKKRRLMPSREMKADDFFDLLEKYR